VSRVELERRWEKLAVRQASAPALGAVTPGLLPVGTGEMRIVFRPGLVLGMGPILDFAQTGLTNLGQTQDGTERPGAACSGGRRKQAQVFSALSVSLFQSRMCR